jgi:hypothetical protein
MNKLPPEGNRRLLNLAIVLVVLSVYTFPYLATTAALKSQQVPFSFAPDLSLYLNLSAMGSSHVNPYFGTPLQSGEIGYMTFDTPFKLLAVFVKIAGNNLWRAILIWNVFWWAAMCVGALWFLRRALPETHGLSVCLAMTLLFFFNFGVVKSELLAWLKLPSLAGFDGLTLPYMRAVFPQIPIALLFPYLAFQVRALHSWSWQDWAVMCFLQAAAFATFPYETLLMAGTTAVAVLATFTMETRPKHLLTVALYGTACAAVDILFVSFRLSGGIHSKHALVSLHLERAIGLVGGGLLSLFLLTVATVVSPVVVSRTAKWTIAGLGIANFLLMLGDVVFSPALLISHHAGYFIHTTIVLQILYLLSAAFIRFGRESVWLKAACIAAIVFTTANGLLLAFAANRSSLAENRTTNDFAGAIRSLNLTKEDLVIARADSVDDLCAWVPILTPAKVMFCRSAQYELSVEEKRTLYRLRQAFYLYFIGRDASLTERAATDSNALPQQESLVFSNENPSDKKGWDEAKASILTDLVPLISQVESRDARTQKFFFRYSRVLVVDDGANPIFVTQRLGSYFSIESERKINGFVFLWCRPI